MTGSLTRYALLHASISGNDKSVIPPNWPIDALRLWPDRRLIDAVSKRPRDRKLGLGRALKRTDWFCLSGP